jgi:hypothetical protein
MQLGAHRGVTATRATSARARRFAVPRGRGEGDADHERGQGEALLALHVGGELGGGADHDQQRLPRGRAPGERPLARVAPVLRRGLRVRPKRAAHDDDLAWLELVVREGHALVARLALPHVRVQERLQSLATAGSRAADAEAARHDVRAVGQDDALGRGPGLTRPKTKAPGRNQGLPGIGDRPEAGRAPSSPRCHRPDRS